jgi:hypothetical protein
VKDVRGCPHLVERCDQARLSGGCLLGLVDCGDHLLALGEDFVIGAVAAEKQEAALVDRLLEHGFESVIDVMQDFLRLRLLF